MTKTSVAIKDSFALGGALFAIVGIILLAAGWVHVGVQTFIWGAMVFGWVGMVGVVVLWLIFTICMIRFLVVKFGDYEEE